jgi:hypothetical protein
MIPCFDPIPLHQGTLLLELENRHASSILPRADSGVASSRKTLLLMFLAAFIRRTSDAGITRHRSPVTQVAQEGFVGELSAVSMPMPRMQPAPELRRFRQ